MGLLPIAPILLLPFIIVFFVVVFPLWGVSLGVVGLLLLIMRALDAIGRAAGVEAFTPVANAVSRAFHWVLTFGGFTERYSQRRNADSSVGTR
jgi:hypothetical protein